MKHKRSDRLVHMRNLACVVEPNQFSIELFFFYMCEKKESSFNILQAYINALLRSSIKQSSINLLTLSIVSILH